MFLLIIKYIVQITSSIVDTIIKKPTNITVTASSNINTSGSNYNLMNINSGNPIMSNINHKVPNVAPPLLPQRDNRYCPIVTL